MPDHEQITFDPALCRQVNIGLGTLAHAYFRSEVRGLHNLPKTGAALVVSNHSGGMLTPDVLVLAHAYYNRFGYTRPLHTLAHSVLMSGPWSHTLRRLGALPASRDNADRALGSGAVVLAFPGGDYDAYRPSTRANIVDFNGRTGYVATALEANAPIVPAVSIGAQESQLFLTRGTQLAQALRLNRFRTKILPISVGVPFGLSVFLPPNIPLPTKIVTQILEPIDVAAFGPKPTRADVDAHVRSVMQHALTALARQRRFPILG